MKHKPFRISVLVMVLVAAVSVVAALATYSPNGRELLSLSYLENTVPKFAHYYGYLLGNKILYRIIPGYHADLGVTMRYNARLEEYFGKRFDSAFLCGQCRKEVSDSQGC